MFECSELAKLRKDYEYLATPREREKQLKIIHGHRQVCPICNGAYQVAGLQQLHDMAYAGSWGKGEK